MLLHYREYYNNSQWYYIIASMSILVNVTTLSRVLQYYSMLLNYREYINISVITLSEVLLY